MTVLELLQRALRLLFETDDTDYRDPAIGFVEELLAETLGENNFLRQRAGKEPLDEIPLIESLETEIPWEQPLLLTVLPYGLASKIVYDDMDMDKVLYWQNRYAAALASVCGVRLEQIEDVYR